MQDFRQLAVWAKSHALTLSIYEVTREFPNDERFGLVSQMRRSSASIAENIAEGSGRGTRRDFGRFLQMAAGSASELEYQLLLARDLRFLNSALAQVLTEQVQEIKRMLNGLRRSVLAADRANAGRQRNPD